MSNETFELESEANQSRTLFKPGSWVTKIDFINHLILFNNALITVLSEKQGGKTSFAALLNDNLDQQIKSISMTITAPCDRAQIISDIAAQLHLNNDSNTDVASLVTQINERKAHVLLVVDDAHHLPESLIKELILEIRNQGDFGFFHLCLVSDYSVVATLNTLSSEEFNHLIHTIELGALSESEIRTYVLQRAMNARLINKPLSDAQIKEFYVLTKGNIAKINSELESFILSASSKKPRKLCTFKNASMVISAALIAGMSYMYFDSVYLKNHATHAEVVPLAKQAISAALEEPKPLKSQIANWQDSSTIQLVQSELPKKQILTDFIEEAEAVSTTAIVDKVVIIPVVKAKNASEGTNIAVTEAVKQSKLVSLNEIAAFNSTSLAEKTNQYTIQLVASHNIDDVHRFKKNNKLATNAIVRQFKNEKGIWYILTFGEYASRSRAQSQISQLPAGLSRLNPWVRATRGLTRVC